MKLYQDNHMKFYVNQEDVVTQDSEGEPELVDRVSIYYINEIHLYIFYSHRYSEYFMKDHYGFLPISDYSKYNEIQPTTENKQGFIIAIFKQEKQR